MSFIDPNTCEHAFQTWYPNGKEMLQCAKCGQDRLPPPKLCTHQNWQETWSAEEHRIQCLNCGLQLTDDRAMLKKIADQYQADADHLREVKAQAWQDGHDTALLHGQSQNPYEGDPQ